MRLYCLLLLLAASPAAAQSLFTQVPASVSGVTFRNKIVESADQNVLAYEYFYNGGGVAVGDLNNDGLPDIVFTGNMAEPRIYLNKGHFKFEDITAHSGVKASGWKTGVTLADVNGDGWLDIFICRSGDGPLSSRTNLLFINQHDGTFKESSAAYGLSGSGNSTQAVFFDYDHDGDLDLFLLRHSIRRLKNFDVSYMKTALDTLAGDQLFRNDGGHFVNVTSSAGIISNPICFGLGAVVADFNGDGWDDLYVTNDYDEDDYLYINQHDGTFRESLRDYMGHTSKFSMGCDVADVNNDGIPDLLTLDMLPESNRRQKMLKGPDGYDHFQNLIDHGYYYQYMRNMLHVGGRYGDSIRYSEIGQLAGISNTDWSWSALFGDFDLDGHQDLFITNGYLRDYTNMDFMEYVAPAYIRAASEQGVKPDLFALVQKMPSSLVHSYFFHNNGDLTFSDSSAAWGVSGPSLSNGAAYGDFDGDGDWDLVVNNINGPAFIMENHAERLHRHYLKLRFAGAGLNKFGIGASVVVSSGAFKQLQSLSLVHGFQSSSEPCLIFGLGAIDTVTVAVTWPSGRKQVLHSVAADQTLTLSEDLATPSDVSSFAPSRFLLQPVSSVPFVHVEDAYNDFKREPLLPHQFSREGPALAVADVNHDGKPDMFVGGGRGQAGALLINMGDGTFVRRRSPSLDSLALFEGVSALFTDLDGDGSPDLYIVSGGNEDNFQDHVLFNDGDGGFHTRSSFIVPPIVSSGGPVVSLGSGLIFRGGQVSTGHYPAAPRSYLFRVSPEGLVDVTPPSLAHVGMVCAATVADVNKDGVPDLIVAGEFMPVTIFYGPSFTSSLAIPHSSGWWNCLTVADIDGDGFLDIVAGNQGLNGQMKPSVDAPVTVDAYDLDGNGSMDAILSYYCQGVSYPVASRDELLDQVPSFKAKFPSYAAYCDATVHDIFSAAQWDSAIHLSAEEFRSGVFFSRSAGWSFSPFPIAAQAFPVRDILCGRFTSDSLQLLLVGNNYAVRAQWGRQDAGKGLLLSCPSLAVVPSGFYAGKDARHVALVGGYIIVVNNNDGVQEFKIR